MHVFLRAPRFKVNLQDNKNSPHSRLNKIKRFRSDRNKAGLIFPLSVFRDYVFIDNIVMLGLYSAVEI